MKKFSRGTADNYNPEQYHSGIILEAIAKIRKDAFEAYERINGPSLQTNTTDDDLGIADLVAGLQGIYENAGKALRAIPSEKRSEASRANGAKGGRPLHTITMPCKVGIYDNSEYTARVYRDKIIVTSPYVKWVGNTGGYAERKEAIRDQAVVDAVIRDIADDAETSAWRKIGIALNDEWLSY